MAKSRGFALPSTKGRILVAAPPLTDPNFDRSVIYMLEHSEGGALGLVLNRLVPDVARRLAAALPPVRSRRIAKRQAMSDLRPAAVDRSGVAQINATPASRNAVARRAG
jgi:hypothetical protein